MPELRRGATNSGNLRCKPNSAKAGRRTYALAVTNCHTAASLACIVRLGEAEADSLRAALGRLFEYGLVLPVTLTAGDTDLDFGNAIAALRDLIGGPFVDAALDAGRCPFRPTDPLSVAVMPVWAFEPEAGSPDVLLGSGRRWGADVLLEALRVDSDRAVGVPPGLEGRFARWAAAAGRPRFLPLPLPERDGSYALFASLTSD